MILGIIGSGPFGISLAINFSKNDNFERIKLYSRNTEIINNINLKKRAIFNDIKLNNKIIATDNLLEILKDSQIIFITVNSNGVPEILIEIKKIASHNNLDIRNKIFIICSKGLDEDGRFFHEISIEILESESIMLLLGPSFAHEIAHGEKTMVNLIYKDIVIADRVIEKLVDKNTNVKISSMDDYIGAQICSIMKNICAMYLGIAKGFGVKNDYIAVLFKFFLDEIKKAINFYGGKESTIFELCGIGDLFLTCTSFESRNYSFGYQIGILKSVSQAFEKCNNYYPEGYYGLKNFHYRNQKNNFFLPICEEIYQFLFTNKEIISENFFNLEKELL